MKKQKLAAFFILIILCCFPVINGYAQETKTIRGTVTDTDNEAIIGASVTIADTTLGTVTDGNGDFELSAPAGGMLNVSYIGFLPYQEKITTSKNIYSITLREDQKALDEVVVVGYGTQKRSDLTGSISSVNANTIKDFSAKSLAESIGGLATGVMVTKTDGSPGSAADIIIRGAGSTNGMKPLYVVDGIAQGAGFEFNMRDVESIEILKDAGSAAIYGSKAAGGVILITTKKGKAGEKTTIEANARYGWRTISTNIQLLDRDDFFRAQEMNSTTPGAYLASLNLGVSNSSELPNVNWMNLLYGTGIEQEYNVSMSGASEKTKFFLSAGFYDEKGVLIDTEAKRFTFRTNIEHKFNKRVTIGETLYGISGKRNPSSSYSVYGNIIPFHTLPFINAYDDTQANGWGRNPDLYSVPNLYAKEMIYHRFQDNGYTLRAQAYTNINFMKGLDLRVTGAGEFYGHSDQNFTERADLGDGLHLEQMDAGAGTSQALTFNAVLTYENKIKDHEFKVMLGTEGSRYDSYSIWVNAFDFPVPVAESMLLSTNENKKAGDKINLDRSMSYFGRINYAYLNKYLLTANIRRDGSARFGPNNRWGTFPSVNAGWRINEESFVKDKIEWLSNAKLRASWGVLGNENNIPLFTWKAQYKNNDVNNPNGGIALFGIPNEDIKWEEVRQADFGLDLGFLNNRLSVVYDYYNRQTRDMLYPLNVPTTGGVSNYFMNTMYQTAVMWMNVGYVENQGHEIAVSWADKAGELKYNVGVNASFNSNKIKDITSKLDNGFIENDEGTLKFARTVDGNAMSLFYGLKVAGIFQTQEQVDEYNAKAAAAERPSGWYQYQYTGVGDLIYEDYDGNGWIDEADRQFIGNPWPKMIYGINTSFEYKGFDLSLLFQGAYGFDILNCVKPYTQGWAGMNTTKEVFETSFMGDNGLTSAPRIGYLNESGSWMNDVNVNKNYMSGNNTPSVNSYLVEKGDYLKLKNLVIGYTLPQQTLRTAGIGKARVYLSMQNVFTLTKYTGIDPEIGGDPVSRGLDHINRYLPSRLISFGVDLTF